MSDFKPISTGIFPLVQRAGDKAVTKPVINQDLYLLPAENEVESSDRLMTVARAILENNKDVEILYVATDGIETAAFNDDLEFFTPSMKQHFELLRVPESDPDDLIHGYVHKLPDMRYVVMIDNTRIWGSQVDVEDAVPMDLTYAYRIVMQLGIPVVTAVPQRDIDLFEMALHIAQSGKEFTHDDPDELTSDMLDAISDEIYNLPRTDNAENILAHKDRVAVLRTDDYDTGRDALIDVIREILQATDKKVLYYSPVVSDVQFICTTTALASKAFAEALPGAPSFEVDELAEMFKKLDAGEESDETMFFQNAILYTQHLLNGRVIFTQDTEDPDSMTMTIDQIIFDIADYIEDNPDDDIAVVIDYPMFFDDSKDFKFLTVGALAKLQTARDTLGIGPIITSAPDRIKLN